MVHVEALRVLLRRERPERYSLRGHCRCTSWETRKRLREAQGFGVSGGAGVPLHVLAFKPLGSQLEAMRPQLMSGRGGEGAKGVWDGSCVHSLSGLTAWPLGIRV